MRLPPFEPGWALFLDVDGTLLDIAERPDQVDTHKVDCSLVEGLQRAAGGALALISGRSLAQLDAMFAPLRLPAAGQHGFERRDVQGRRHRHRFPVETLAPARDKLRAFADRHAGLVLEDKGASLALHYRLAPELAQAALEAVRQASAPLGGAVQTQGGKMVWELKPSGADKGSAIDEFMREPPFAGRKPVFMGDDITDEYGFRVVNRLGGHSIKVGTGDSAARWRLANPQAARAWLRAWLETFPA
ncbi:MAG TPA: trehalose-phosphatase [Burkholderiales bacterium]|nr:trehalose-phosphatase [Burkholderiales bacterium]